MEFFQHQEQRFNKLCFCTNQQDFVSIFWNINLCFKAEDAGKILWLEIPEDLFCKHVKCTCHEVYNKRRERLLQIEFRKFRKVLQF